MWEKQMQGVWVTVPTKEPQPNPNWAETANAKRLKEGLEKLEKEQYAMVVKGRLSD